MHVLQVPHICNCTECTSPMPSKTVGGAGKGDTTSVLTSTRRPHRSQTK